MALMTRPFLTVEEMAGVPVAQAQNIDSATMLNYGKVVGQTLTNQESAMRLDALRKQKQEADDYDAALAADLAAARGPEPQGQPAPATAPGATPQVQPAPQQAPVVVQAPAAPQAPVAQSYPVAPQTPDNSRPLAPEIRSTGDFARFDRQMDAQAAAEPASQVVEVNGKRMTEQQKAEFDAVNPQQAQAPAPMPATAAQPTVPQAPQAMTKPDPAAEVTQVAGAAQAGVKLPSQQAFDRVQRGTALTKDGMFNPLSDDFRSVMTGTLSRLVSEGKMRPSTAQAIYMANEAAVNKSLEDKYKIMKAAAEAREKGLAADKIAEELAKLKKESIAENADRVIQLFTKSPAAAQAVLPQYGFGGMDLSNPAHFDALRGLAASSKVNSDLRVKAGEAAIADGQLKPVPGVPGVFYSRDGKMVDGAGKPLTTAQVQDMELASKRAGAPQVNVDTQKGKTKFQEKIGEQDAESLQKLRDRSVALANNYRNFDTIEAAVKNPDGSIRGDAMFGPGQGISAFFSRAGITEKKDQELFRRNTIEQASAAIELDAAGAMKGQGAITDAERAILRRAASGDFNNFTAAEWAAYASAAKKAAITGIDRNNAEVDNIIKRRGSEFEGLDVNTYKFDHTPLTKGSVAPQAAVKTVTMVSPGGKVTQVPENEVQEAVRLGFMKGSK